MFFSSFWSVKTLLLICELLFLYNEHPLSNECSSLLNAPCAHRREYSDTVVLFFLLLQSGVSSTIKRAKYKLHPRLQLYLQDCMSQGNVPEWMLKGRTVLIRKGLTKDTQASNYRPIACLPITRKLLTGIMGKKLYQHLERNGLIADEQKGCRKGSRGAKYQLMIDKAILMNCRRSLTNLSMAWIDCKTANDMVPHSWILKCLELVWRAKNMINVISNSMVNWKTSGHKK